MAGNLKFSSSTPLVNVHGRPGRATGLGIDRLGLVSSLEWSVAGTLALLVVVGFGLRVSQLAAIGFAEDEMNKVDAVRAYERGDFSVNAEHPMLMKVLMWLCSC